MKSLFATLLVVVLGMNVSLAADDPMTSLFMFQQQMAQGGNPAAMMKLGEMYEKGEGTKRDLNKAREMYEKAKAKGHPKADAALSNLNKKQGRTTKQVQQDKAAQQKAAQERAAREKAAQEKLAKEKAAQQRAAQEKAAKERAEQLRASK